MTFSRATAGLLITGALVVLALTAAAIFGIFTPNVVLGIFGAGVIALVVYLRMQWRKTTEKDSGLRWDILVLLFIVALSVATAWLQHGMPRGRDDMGILTAAVKLTETHRLSFFDPLSGPFHPYREIAPGEYTSQFLPGYTAVLASAFHFGGFVQAGVANGVLVFLTLLVLYCTGSTVHSRLAGFGFVLVFATSYLFFWIPRRTLSENLFILLLWIAVYALVRGYRERSSIWLLLGTIPLATGLLVRVEGMLYLGAYIVAALLAVYAKRRDFSFRPRVLIALVPLLASGLLLWRYASRFGAEYFQASYGHVLNGSTVLPLLAAGLVGLFLLFAAATVLQRYHIAARRTAKVTVLLFILLELGVLFLWLPGKSELPWSALKMHFVIESFLPYFFLPFVLLAVIGYIRGSFHAPLLWVSIFLLPMLVFVWDPLIALDQPWFLRRYYPALIPFVLLLGSIGLADLLRRFRHVALGSFLLLALIQVGLFHPLVRYRDHEGVARPLQEIAASFPDNALVLMEPGWAWQQWAYALHYVDGMDVLPNLDTMTAEKLDALFATHPAVYVISTRPDTFFLGIPDAALRYERTIQFSYPELQSTTNLNRYLREHERLDVNFIQWSQKQNPPLTIQNLTEEWGVYRVNDPSALHGTEIFSLRNAVPAVAEEAE